MKQERAIIIGAGSAGLTAAIELERRTGITPIVVESSHEIGGISRTVCYKGNRMDIGGHRFFSKSDRVMKWWMEMMPVEAGAGERASFAIRANSAMYRRAPGANPQTEDLVMLVRQRKSRIYFLRRFFDYPIRLTADTLRKLGAVAPFAADSATCARRCCRDGRTSLEDFLINRFGKQLYLTFFKSYTEKVWGVPCHQISAEWGAQRIKGLSLKGVVVTF